jgi:hypothetical protein
MYSLFDQKLALNDVSDIFSSTSIECARALLGISCELKEPWKFVPRLDAEYENVVIMGSASDLYQAILAIGMNDSSVEGFFGKLVDKNEFFDIFGEVANNFCAMILDNYEFYRQFGILNQSIPVLYSNGIPFLPFISGIEGRIYSNNQFAYFGFAIQKRRKV